MLARAVVSAVLTAYVQAVSLSVPEVFDSYRYWVVGSLAGRDFGVALTVLPVIAAAVVAAHLTAGGLNALALGEEAALSTGANTAAVRATALVASTVLAAAAAAADLAVQRFPAADGLPVGIVTMALGGVYLGCLLIRQRRRGVL